MSKEIVHQLASLAGITIGKDVIVRDERFYDRVFSDGSLGLGESYMEGWWDTGDKTLDQLSYIVNSTDLNEKLQGMSWELAFKMTLNWAWRLIFPVNTIEESKVVAEQHYDLGNELYTKMLGFPSLYSCGYYRNADSLIEAQVNKLELIARKLQLAPGARVLEIGCGWGDLAVHLSRRAPGVHVTAITISEEQYNYCIRQHVNENVKFELVDYRKLDPHYKFDAIVSVGMFEHVNPNNYREYMEICTHLLKDGGIFLLHTIGKNKSEIISDPWISKYIFPNSTLPSLKQIMESSEGLLVPEDVHNFGPYYDLTLQAWYRNFQTNFRAINQERLLLGKSPFDAKFKRMWEYYLLMCAGLFRARKAQLYQVVFSKNGPVYHRPDF